MNRLTKEQEEALRAAEKAATPGDWCVAGVCPPRCNCDHHRGRPIICTVRPGTVLAKSVVGHCHSDPAIDDASFVALARNTMPALLDELAALRAEKARLVSIVERGCVALESLDCTVLADRLRDEAKE